MDAWLVIGLSGVTCSGKTTISRCLLEYFQDLQQKTIKETIRIEKVVLMQQDNYFIPRDSPHQIKVNELPNVINREVIGCLDMEKMCREIQEVLGENFVLYKNADPETDEVDNMFAGHYVNVKFAQKKTSPYVNLNILLLEGFLLFNHEYTRDLCNLKFHLHVPKEMCYKRRLERKRERLNAPDAAGYFDVCVWPEYERHFKEFKDMNGMVLLNGALSKKQILKFMVDQIENAL